MKQKLSFWYVTANIANTRGTISDHKFERSVSSILSKNWNWADCRLAGMQLAERRAVFGQIIFGFEFVICMLLYFGIMIIFSSTAYDPQPRHSQPQPQSIELWRLKKNTPCLFKLLIYVISSVFQNNKK